MWLVTCLANGFQTPTEVGHVQFFRFCIAIAALWKAAVAVGYGNWNIFQDGSFARWQLARKYGLRWTRILTGLHKPALIGRLTGSMLLVAGHLPKFAICVIVVGHLHELLYQWHFHTIYMTACLGALLFAGDLGRGLATSDNHDTTNTFAQFLVVIITIDMYLNSAWLKFRSRQFRGGLYLAQLAWVSAQVRRQQPRWDYWHPAKFANHRSAAGAPGLTWAAMAGAVIVMELVLPIGLLVPGLSVAFMALGVGMHVLFTAISPIRLLPFTITAVASYGLFLP
jgi:hypothetical protein